MISPYTSILRTIANLNQLSAKNDVLLQQISTGKKISSPADDPSLYFRLSRYEGELAESSIYLNNIGEGVGLMSTLNGAVQSQMSLLQQMLETASKAQSSTLTSSERSALQDEMDRYVQQLDEIVQSTTSNSKLLLDGSYETTPFSIITGPGQNYDIYIPSTDAQSLQVDNLSLSSKSNSTTAYNKIKNAIDQLNQTQSSFGTDEFILNTRSSLLESKQAGLQSVIDQYQQVDVVKAAAELDRNQLIQQYSLAAIASMQDTSKMLLAYLFPSGR